ncbi:hypothetical protein TcarDRAFT_1814 [Thermosinus carboxydivorans Nor1]|uniref:Major facilitator superfamily (MFS) profile domain-containing protein n=1 Tax=Thermosinus carboxydivorans Nor1 TaxID=401526 RepID=A1HP92_9FIRM|nr:MFS transporter [Thermosinus carboxydivorans]EAX48267.1 hypothetical protein TcarDRAFT_1814 [Thermosinus carboxydivorans Nor1]
METVHSVSGASLEAVKPTRQRLVLVAILLFTLLVAYLDRVNVSVLLADNAFLTDMGIKGQPVQMGLLMTLFLIAYGVANVVLSPLGDYIGPRKAMSISIFLWTISVLIGGFATTFYGPHASSPRYFGHRRGYALADAEHLCQELVPTA